MVFKQIETSIIIPTKNEADHLIYTIDEIQSDLEKSNINYEIIIIDDGSFDNTALVAKQIGIDKIIRNDSSIGKINSILKIINLIESPIIVTIDADGVIDPNNIANYIRYIKENKADIILGARYIPKYKKTNILALIFRLLNTIIYIFMKKIFRKKISIIDSQTSFRVGKTETFKKIFNQHILSKNPSDSELNIKLIWNNPQVIYLPVVFRLRESYGYSKKESNSFNIIKYILIHVISNFLNHILKGVSS